MKQNKKQIEANLRNKMAAQYKASAELREKRIDELIKENSKLFTRATTAEQENLELKDKVNQLEDWIQRLQEYMDMNDEDRQAYITNLKLEKQLNDAIDGLYSVNWIKHFIGLI